MALFLGIFGVLLWFVGFIVMIASPAVTQEIVALLIALNGTVMVVGGGIISAISLRSGDVGQVHPPTLNVGRKDASQSEAPPVPQGTVSDANGSTEASPVKVILFGLSVVILVWVVFFLFGDYQPPPPSPSP